MVFLTFYFAVQIRDILPEKHERGIYNIIIE